MIASETEEGQPYAEIQVGPGGALRVEVAPGGAEIRLTGASSIPIEFAGELVGGIVAVVVAAGRGGS